MKVINRAKAKRLKLKRFFTGKPCIQGHISERWTLAGGCVACFKEMRQKNAVTGGPWSNGKSTHPFRHKAWYARRYYPGSTITAAELFELWKEQNGRCAITGEKMVLRGGGHLHNNLSLDRIVPGKPYRAGNVRLVTYQVNAALGVWGVSRLKAMCRNILRRRT